MTARNDTVYYAYPYKRELSFAYIGDWHVRLINEKYHVFPITLTALPSILSIASFHGYMHPYFYPLSSNGEIHEKVFNKFRNNIATLIAVDVADSNMLSPWAVEMANKATAFIVNSQWSYDAFVNSGVKVPVHVVPHGLEDEWFRPQMKPVHATIRFLHDLKIKTGVKYILYFLWHSGYRKGADLAAKLIECINKYALNYALIIKKMDITDPGISLFTRFKTFIIEGKLPRDWLIDLYDIADLVLLPSRGGSFEMNGLEALGRGIPVLMPNVGPWTEYTPPGLEKWLWVKTAKMVPVLPGNSIHVGLGAEWDPDDACEKAIEILTNNEIKTKAQEGVEWIKQRYSWNAIKTTLWKIHEKYFT